MGYILFTIFVLLSLSLLLSFFKEGRRARIFRIIRWAAVSLTILFFAWKFAEDFFKQPGNEDVSVQVINSLPQPLDFYLISRDTVGAGPVIHLGKIRPDHYRMEYLRFESGGELWLAGFLGNKNMVYLSRHPMVSRNLDPIIEVRSYEDLGQVLHARAEKEIGWYRTQATRRAVLAVLCLLLLFVNVIPLLRKSSV
ncbi:hypothetical protein ACF3N7_02805 [Cruoricaptor ignavus]|uniref:hypothetical protein n=1 Tax=Cruoricaptor ignavus TaxID=1118202 RepID=UPI00370D49C2